MKPAITLTEEQKTLRGQLAVAVERINEADDLLTKNTEAANTRALALVLSAVGKVLILETAEKYGLQTRIGSFKQQPK